MGCGMSTLEHQYTKNSVFGKKTLQDMSDDERQMFYKHLQLYARLRQ